MTAVHKFEFDPKPNGRLQVRCALSEGTLTVSEGAGVRGSRLNYAFASQIQGPKPGVRVGDKVVAAGVTSDGKILVAKRAYTDQQPIGEVITAPEFVGVPPTTETTYTWGNYTPREATILFYGKRIRTLPLYMAQSDNLAAGNYLKPCAVNTYHNYFAESSTLTSRVALNAVNASSSAASTSIVPVLEGFEQGT